MKLSSFLAVDALVAERNHLAGLKDEGAIDILISGHRQTREFVQHVEHAVRLELRYRIHEIDQQLIELGVTIE